MKLSEYKDEDALDVLAELIEPASDILSDAGVREAATDGKMAKAASLAIKNHKHSVLCILAAIERVPVEDYHCNVLTLPLKLIELLNDPDIMQVFISAGQMEAQNLSGSHTENIVGDEQ